VADSAPYGIVKRTANIPMSFFNLSQNVLGAGAFAIPASVAATGLGGGIFLLLLIAVIAMFTLLVLTYFTNTLRQQSYQGIITHTLGKRVAFVAQLLVLFYTYGSAIIYLQLIRDNLSVPLQEFFGQHVYTNKLLLLTLYTIAVPGPLSYLRNMASLSYGSMFGVAFVLYAVVFVAADGIIYLTQTIPHSNGTAPVIIEGFNPSIQFAVAFPNLVFAFMTHVGFVPIAAELVNPTMMRTGVVVSSSFGLCILLYFAIGIVGYTRIGNDCFANLTSVACVTQFPYFEKYVGTDPSTWPDLTNILNFYPPTDIFATVGRFGMCLTLGMGYPLSTFVGRLTLRTLFNKNREFSTLVHFLITTVWVATTLALAIGLQSISVVFSFVGSIAGSGFMMVFPGIILMQTFRHNILVVIGAGALALFGCGAGVIAIVAHFIG
jgi:amino acid permease